jgi:hypothetical protein
VSSGNVAKITNVLGGTASNLIPFNRLIKPVQSVFTERPDTSSVEAAVYANLPVVSAFESYPALNMLGDPIGDQSLGGKLWFAGSPVIIKIPHTDLKDEVYSLFRLKGQAPPTPMRPAIEAKYGRLSEEQWYRFVKRRGGMLKADVYTERIDLRSLDPYHFDRSLSKMATAAEKETAEVMNLIPKEKPDRD